MPKWWNDLLDWIWDEGKAWMLVATFVVSCFVLVIVVALSLVAAHSTQPRHVIEHQRGPVLERLKSIEKKQDSIEKKQDDLLNELREKED